MTIQETILKILEKQKDVSAFEDAFELVKALEQTDFTAAHELNKTVRKKSATILRQEGTSLPELDRAYRLQKKTLLFDAPYSLDEYIQYVEYDREPQKKFYIPRRKILLSVVQAIQAVIDDKLDLLSISLPPGTGKTTLKIMALSWYIGKYPDKPCLDSAHSGMMTSSTYEGVLQVIRDPEYLWRDVFPTARDIITNAKELTIDVNKKHRFSSLTCRAIGASLTGATRCEGLLTADDLCSGIEEAMSKERLDKLWEKYVNDLKSRKKQGAKEIHIATRWSVHDVIGQLERMYDGDERARFIVVPALDEQGDSNFNFKFGVGFNTQYFLDMKNNLDDVSFKALYMNQPIEREGQLYNEDELRRYFTLPDSEPDAILSICDTKDIGTDYEFLPVAYQYGADFYIEDCVLSNIAIEVLDDLCAEMLLRHKVKMCRFESNSAGGRTADKVQEKVREKGGVTHITKKFTTANKETKIIVNSPFVKERFLFRDRTMYKAGSDYAKMINFLCSYTVMGKNKNDDVPDGLAMLAEFVQSLSANVVEVFKRPF